MCARASAAQRLIASAAPKAPGDRAKLGSLLAKAEDGSMARPHARPCRCRLARRIGRGTNGHVTLESPWPLARLVVHDLLGCWLQWSSSRTLTGDAQKSETKHHGSVGYACTQHTQNIHSRQPLVHYTGHVFSSLFSQRPYKATARIHYSAAESLCHGPHGL